MPAKVGRHDMEIRLQLPCDRIPVSAVIQPTMNQDQRRRRLVSPIGIMETQSLGFEKAACRFGHSSIVSSIMSGLPDDRHKERSNRGVLVTRIRLAPIATNERSS